MQKNNVKKIAINSFVEINVNTRKMKINQEQWFRYKDWKIMEE
jgi:hypothetical protein